MEIKKIFENLIKIEPKVMSIESLFNNPERVKNTDYKPSYQRNYVWDDDKASYFIESILLGTEIPPLIYFRNSDKVEVIDGRQRYQTILRFINNEFKLKKNGLHKLDEIGIANKYFKDLDDQLEYLFWDTKLRIIEFSFHSKNLIDDEIEEIVKKEIFKRYNSGITPLKPTEIDRAAYFKDDLNSFIKDKLQKDAILYKDVSSLFHFEKTNTEIILKKIRQLLVQHQIPIKYYSVKKETVISKYYEFLFSNITFEEIESLYNGFIEKINLIRKIRNLLLIESVPYNRLISEGLFWAFSVMEAEQNSLKLLNSNVIDDLVSYINNNIEAFSMVRSSFSKELYNRYLITSIFFKERFDIDFFIYLQYNLDFKLRNKEIAPKNQERTSFDELRINKPEPSSIAIVDICRQMERQRFLIRPPYQRNEVINKKKSSSIIESILLGIKLPPIFVFKRLDDVSEVLDGQQRLLSILGFIKKPYLDENNEFRHSDKDGYSLNLKHSILKDLNGKKFEQLDQEQQDKINNFDLWIIEISQKNNTTFEPIDLFIRLNNKPYPIKEDTFEMWNSYISRDIINTIKSIHKNSKDWFYLRKNNSRMEDENIYTSLAYLEFSIRKKGIDENYISKDLDVYKVVDKINFRVKSKNEITKVLEDADLKDEFIEACNRLEFTFIKKLKALVSDDDDNSSITLNKNLDEIFKIDNGRRTQQSFYALWYFLYALPEEVIINKKTEIRECLMGLYSDMTSVENKSTFELKVQDFRSKYRSSVEMHEAKSYSKQINNAFLGDISKSHQGTSATDLQKSITATPRFNYPYYKKTKFENLALHTEDVLYINLDERASLKEFSDPKPKILVKRTINQLDRFQVCYYEQKAVFNNDVFCIIPTRIGFLPKYLLSVIGSRYVYFLHNKKYSISKLEDQKSITSGELNNLKIPLLDLENQQPFIRVTDFILNKSTKIEQRLFFIRLIDAMVYEIFFNEEFKNINCEFINNLMNLPELNPNEEGNEIKVNKVYNELSNPNHRISASLLKLLNIKSVKVIEEA